MPRKSKRAIDFSDIPEASVEQLNGLRRVAMRRGTPSPSASIPAESAEGQSLRSDEAEPSERDTREAIRRGLANAKACRTTPAQRVFDELRRKHGIPQHDEACQRLRTDVQAGFDQLARGEARSFDEVSGRRLARRIKSRGRAAHAPGPSGAFDVVKTVGLSLPDVEATSNWAGAPVLKVHGTFVAGLASHRSVEPGTLVVRCALDDRERLLEDAPETYYVTDYYRPYPVVLARLSHLNRDALHDLLAVSRRMALDKVRRPAQRPGARGRPAS